MNYVQTLAYLFPNLNPPFDYSVGINESGEQYISAWNVEDPAQPTEETLTATSDKAAAHFEQLVLVGVVQSIMDAKAQSYHYDNLTTAVTYADEPAVPKFQQEGQAFRAWRSQVWATAYSILADVQAGSRTFPTVSEVPGLLPAFPLDPAA
ncbi:hypothetical protein AWB76_07224 [Caballeronia temeraria]|uniref:Bacteriophage SP-beta YorD domain-containing protein n=1 Tax=Caballeronia temeraria TaxID=1777137 RepID=A0A158DN79_9BURK|nr:hypothetical protein [Caballeronia temeraria]SAK95943.1 hypothetical protein AWB76_07224 [Caballeronia temeraria]